MFDQACYQILANLGPTLRFVDKLNSKTLYPETNHKKANSNDKFKNKQARVAQLVARRLAVPEIRVQTPPGAN